VETPKPKLWAVLYAKPNPDGSTKTCGNCTLWSRDGKCSIHAPDVPVSEDHICGHHVNGEPASKQAPRENLDPVDPKTSGLKVVPGGTSCEGCKFFDGVADKGVCHGVDRNEDASPAVVEAKGSCTRWEDGRATKKASVRVPGIGAISRGVYVELHENEVSDRSLATKIAMDNLTRDPEYYR
jgi:hypothetical protein